MLAAANVTVINVTVPGYTLEKLVPNSQYIVWVKAHTDAGDSLPSETLLAWTDPAYPAYVEVRTNVAKSLYLKIDKIGVKLALHEQSLGKPFQNI